MTDLVDHPYQLEFYADSSGHQPVRHWLLAELSAQERRTVGAALYQILQQHGVGVCGTAFGRQLCSAHMTKAAILPSAGRTGRSLWPGHD